MLFTIVIGKFGVLLCIPLPYKTSLIVAIMVKVSDGIKGDKR